jgi:CDP-glucose 4,6-dehydratase
LKVLVTGHTGFKGSWLSLMLAEKGHEVFGISMAEPSDSLHHIGGFQESLSGERFLDLANRSAVAEYLHLVRPDCIFHFAAESLVLRSQEKPIKTLETNILGTANLLAEVAKMPNNPILIVTTTDKVYKESTSAGIFHTEESTILGSEAYSYSKVAQDELTQAYMYSLKKKNWGIVRAGNVIGGGDRAPNRLIPDFVLAYANGKELQIRNSNATRPWQHVLDCLSGYLSLMNHLEDDPGSGIWNFGPDRQDVASVGTVLEIISNTLPGFRWVNESGALQEIHESLYLGLDSSKAKSILGWYPKYDIRDSLRLTLEWELSYAAGESAKSLTQSQIRAHVTAGQGKMQ